MTTISRGGWTFIVTKDERWSWRYVDSDPGVERASVADFETLVDCLHDASINGYSRSGGRFDYAN